MAEWIVGEFISSICVNVFKFIGNVMVGRWVMNFVFDI